MGTARVVVVLGLLSTAVAQQQRAELLQVDDLAQRFTADQGQPVGAVQPIARFVFVAGLLLQQEGTGSRSSLASVATAGKSGRLLVRSSADEMALVKGMLAQLRLEQLPRARLQCSFLTMPAALVKTHGLTADKFVPTDETAFGKLVRVAVKEKGVLQNLPESMAEPVVPFVLEPAAKVGKAATRADLRVRGEMVPIEPGQVAFAMQLVRGGLPVDRTQAPKESMLNGAFRLSAGKAVMAVAVAGDQATIVFVRCTEVTGDVAKEKVGR